LIDVVYFTRLQGEQPCRGVGDDFDDDAIKVGLILDPVVGIAHQRQVVAPHPFGELEGPRTHGPRERCRILENVAVAKDVRRQDCRILFTRERE
jgi:hypothetical protein